MDKNQIRSIHARVIQYVLPQPLSHDFICISLANGLSYLAISLSKYGQKCILPKRIINIIIKATLVPLMLLHVLCIILISKGVNKYKIKNVDIN
jgi:hypothetical protein